MNPSLIISLTMNLNQLADRMGGATAHEALAMRSVLFACGYDNKTTAEVPGADWLKMLDTAVKLAAMVPA